jgi:hypothetical protein
MLTIFLLSAFLQQTPDLIRILEATRQEWTGGRKETGKGVDYEIKMAVQKGSARLKFVSITVEQQGCDFKVSNMSHPEKDSRFHKGDTLMIDVLLKNPKEPLQTKVKPYPVIGCSYKRSIYYFPIRQGISIEKNNNR